ncbi:MAG: hypothetical protein R2707_09005 [Acidimicrobiales bacterium]
MNDGEALDLGPIEDRLSNSTPGPWFRYAFNDDKFTTSIAVATVPQPQPTSHRGRFPDVPLESFVALTMWPDVFSSYQADADASFIANAPTDIAALIAEVRRLRELLR